jgi:hypothetical protein
MNYDPNLVASGRMAMQTVTLVFQQWQYVAKTYVDVGGNCLGAEIIDCAISQAYEELSQNIYGKTHITMHLGCSETLTVVDEEEEGEDWLAKMLVKFEITRIVSWDGTRNKDTPSPLLKQKSELKKQPPVPKTEVGAL